MKQNQNNSEFRVVGNNDNQTTFEQTQSLSSEGTNSSSNDWREVPRYPQGKRSADEGTNCSKVTGNGRFYM